VDARRLLELVARALAAGQDAYALAAAVAAEQKEQDAQTAEALGASDVAAAIRG
jgi:hypothetical protein